MPVRDKSEFAGKGALQALFAAALDFFPRVPCLAGEDMIYYFVICEHIQEVTT